MLQSFAQKYSKRASAYDFLEPVFTKMAVEHSVKQLLDADIVGFSMYVWNIQRSLVIAQLLKLQNPEVQIVVGGPQIPDNAEQFLEQNPFIDVCCHGEGEQVFLDVLDSFPENKWTDIPGLSYFSPLGKFIHQPRAARRKNLSEIPSPYLSGVFDKIIKKYPNIQWSSLWETNRGCPFSCTFCDWGSATQSKVTKFDIERLEKEIRWFALNRFPMMFCCDANFGILKRDVEIAKYIAKIKNQTGYPKEFHQTSAKNSTQRVIDIHEILNEASIATEASLAIQSLDPETLKIIKRENISLKSYFDINKQLVIKNILSYSDVIVGLPGETFEAFSNGICELMTQGQYDKIKFYCLAVLPNAPMNDPEYRKEHGLQTVKMPFTEQFYDYKEDEDRILEYKELVIATKAMPREMWVKAKVYSWFVCFVYFRLKVLQIPFVILHQLFNIPYKTLLDLFLTVEEAKFPTIFNSVQLFEKWAIDMQNGVGAEFIPSKQADFLELESPILLMPETFVLLKLLAKGTYSDFYKEAQELLMDYCQSQGYELQEILLRQILQFNSNISKILFQSEASQANIKYSTKDISFHLDFNLPDYYQSILNGQPIPLEHVSTVCYKNWEGAPYTLDMKRSVMV